MSTGNETDERDPYAPPPEGAPDRPPAAPWNVPGGGREPGGEARSERPETREPRDTREPREPREPRDRQGSADPRRRNARIALWVGVWALFLPVVLPADFTLVLGLVMGVAAVAVGIRALRGTGGAGSAGPRVERGRGSTARRDNATTPPPASPAPEPARARGPRPRAAMAGIATGAIAVALVGSAWGFRAANPDYFDCMDAALTKTAQDACRSELPDSMHWVIDAPI